MSNFFNPSSPDTTYRTKREIPWVTYTMLGITVVVYLLQLLTQTLLGGDIPASLGAKAMP